MNHAKGERLRDSGKATSNAAEAHFRRLVPPLKTSSPGSKKSCASSRRDEVILGDVEQRSSVCIGPTCVSPDECFREFGHHALPNRARKGATS